MDDSRNYTQPSDASSLDTASERTVAARLEASIAEQVTFATHQAAIPLVRDLRVINGSDAPIYEDLSIELSCDPPVVLPQAWHISRLQPDEEISLLARNVRLDGGMLDRLTERLRATATFRLRHGDTVLDESTHELVALARSEWGGATSMPELLAAFIQPNHPSIAALLADASDLLRAANRPHSFEGYQSGARDRPWEMAAAIWTATANRRLVYAEPPRSFERSGQKVRDAGAVLEQRLATCLDTAVMFAAALEQAGLNPLICLVEGHAVVGVWLRDTTLPELITDDASLLRRYIALQDLVLFETTLVTSHPPTQFSRAVEAGARRVREEVEQSFVYALDVHQARGRGIHPLPSLDSAAVAGGEPQRAAELVLEAPPPLRPIEEEIAPPRADTPDARVEHWKRRLLDLTKRNRLLNLKTGKSTIRLVCPDIGSVEDRLSAGHTLAIVPVERLLGEGGGREETIYTQQTARDYTEDFATKALVRNQLAADLPKAELNAGLVELYRKAAADLREGGANTLFLAVGTLRWRPTDKADGPFYRAPVLLIPVVLERASAATTPKLRRHSDEPVVNLTLLEMLRQDFGIALPELSSALPRDEFGIDVPEVLRILRLAIGNARGWSVEHDVVLGTFSFAKYLMWKDLCDRTEDLKRSRFVSHMIDTPHERYDRHLPILNERELDARVDPKELFTPLPADSSQLAAIFGSGHEGDLVLEGPPGTGKSQTIANIIAHNLALGRRVLFVAEKMTALSVVHERLARVGLGDFCLELHSNKATRRSVVDQLDKAWQGRGSKTSTEWEVEARRLTELRTRLNRLVQALHAPSPSGISARAAISGACTAPFDIAVSLDWPRSLAMDRASSPEELGKLRELATKLGEAHASLGPDERHLFGGIHETEWSHEWTAALVDAARILKSATADVTALARRVTALIAPGMAPASPQHLEALADAGELLMGRPDAASASFLSAGGDHHIAATSLALDALATYRSAHQSLPLRIAHDRVLATDHEGLLTDWKAASQRLLPVRLLQQWLVRRKAAAAWGTAPVGNFESLARRTAALRRSRTELDSAGQAVPAVLAWQGLDTDEDRLRRQVEVGRKLRRAALRLAAYSSSAADAGGALASALASGADRFADGMPDHILLSQFSTAHERFSSALAAFCALARRPNTDFDTLESLLALADAVTERSSRLNAWCRWKKAVSSADSAGLSALARALENGLIEPDQTAEAFDVAYCRWLAPLLIDAREELRTFSAVEHERLITQFRALDEELASVASREIRARLSAAVPRREERAPLKGYSILLREVQTKRSARTVRTVLSELGKAVSQLTPCMMMSPMSVAQFIPADAEPFDLVVFDEASQITTWDAIGAIARGRNVIIVGDPKQMPPTNFFNRSADDDDEEVAGELEGAVPDLESILDEALATGMALHRLTGHYRSRHESLIAFSNHAYYGGSLVTYPAAETRSSAVSLVRVAGSYQKGKDRTNPTEAKAVVAEVSRRLRDPILRHQTIGIVTMNTEQQRLIRNLLDDERRGYPEIERAFIGRDGEEVDMVYNLETVQGHERDVIFLSVGYGPAEPGGRSMSMNFGPLNKSGGERRWNVAITRASHETTVFTSFGPEMIDLTRTKARAVEDLKHYLEFAERGPVALRQATRGGIGPDRFDSPFEEAVASALRGRGWSVRTQIGVSQFRVDLGIVHPDSPGRFIAGVECDGATYHGSPTARDRDRVRHNILSQLGWTLIRLWSTDYFLDPRGTIDRIHSSLTALLERDRASSSSDDGQEQQEDQQEEQSDESKTRANYRPQSPLRPAPPATPEVAVAPASYHEFESPPADDATDGTGDLRLYDDLYLPQLTEQCLALIDQAGPMQMRYLAERIARAHGFLRTGKTIRSRVWRAVGNARTITEDPNLTKVVWPATTEPAAVLPFRGSVVAGIERAWDYAPHAERLGLALEIVRKNGGIPDLAAAIGVGRLRDHRRRELEDLLSEAKRLAQ